MSHEKWGNIRSDPDPTDPPAPPPPPLPPPSSDSGFFTIPRRRGASSEHNKGGVQVEGTVTYPTRVRVEGTVTYPFRKSNFDEKPGGVLSFLNLGSLSLLHRRRRTEDELRLEERERELRVLHEELPRLPLVLLDQELDLIHDVGVRRGRLIYFETNGLKGLYFQES